MWWPHQTEAQSVEPIQWHDQSGVKILGSNILHMIVLSISFITTRFWSPWSSTALSNNCASSFAHRRFFIIAARRLYIFVCSRFMATLWSLRAARVLSSMSISSSKLVIVWSSSPSCCFWRVRETSGPLSCGGTNWISRATNNSNACSSFWKCIRSYSASCASGICCASRGPANVSCEQSNHSRAVYSHSIFYRISMLPGASSAFLPIFQHP